MKKIYTLILAMVLAVLCGASIWAKTITITIDNPEAAYYCLADEYGSYSPGAWNDDNSVVLEFSENITIPVYANYGYELDTVTFDGFTFSPNPSYYTVSTDGFDDGAVIAFTTKKKESKVLKIIGDPAVIALTDDKYQEHNASDNVDGAWTLTDLSDYGSTYIRTIDEEYLITKVYDDNGNEFLSSPAETAEIYNGSLSPGLNTVTVETKKATDIYDGNVTVNVNGSRFFVSFRFNGQYNGIDLKSGSNTVLFNTETDLPFRISNAYDSSTNPQSLYQVSLNGEVLVPEDRVYVITSVNNGDVIDIEVDPPLVEIPVSVSFADETSKNALMAIYSDGSYVDPSTYSSFNGKLGKTLQFRFDTENYNVTLTENGVEKTPYGSYNVTLSEEAGYTYIVKATPVEPLNVTIVCEQFEHLIVSPDYYLETVYDLTGVETVISVQPSEKYTYIKAAEGWSVKSITDGDTGNELGSSLYVYDGQTIIVELEEYARDKYCTLYTEPCDWASTYYGGYYPIITLNTDDYDLMYQFSAEPGYSTIAYNDKDRPFGITAYDVDYNPGEVFLNGELVEGFYGSYPALADLQEGDVIKIMSKGAPRHDVTYNVSEEVSVKVVHDFTMTVDHTAAHQVHTGTEIHVIPVTRDGAGIKVLAGETELTPDEDGKFVHTVTEPVEITVLPAVPTSIIDIEAAAGEASDVYNLQGIKVLNAATPDAIKALPAGIYIVGGKKTIVK